jgi:hypothetical protein
MVWYVGAKVRMWIGEMDFEIRNGNGEGKGGALGVI